MVSRNKAPGPDHDWKRKQNLPQRNYMMRLGQPAVQYMLDVDGRAVEVTF